MREDLGGMDGGGEGRNAENTIVLSAWGGRMEQSASKGEARFGA